MTQPNNHWSLLFSHKCWEVQASCRTLLQQSDPSVRPSIWWDLFSSQPLDWERQKRIMFKDVQSSERRNGDKNEVFSSHREKFWSGSWLWPTSRADMSLLTSRRASVISATTVEPVRILKPPQNQPHFWGRNKRQADFLKEKTKQNKTIWPKMANFSKIAEFYCKSETFVV